MSRFLTKILAKSRLFTWIYFDTWKNLVLKSLVFWEKKKNIKRLEDSFPVFMENESPRKLIYFIICEKKAQALKNCRKSNSP